MKLKELLSEKNEALYQEVESKIHIKLKKYSKPDSWASEVKNKEAIIYFSDTKNKEAAFTHELLHFYTQLKGYKNIRVGFSQFDQTPSFATLLSALDNELQHHRMFSLFKSYGYPDADFYSESDIDTEKLLRDEISYCKKNLPRTIVNFLTIIAPGGCFTEQIKNELKEIYKSIEGRRVYLDNIESIFNRWTVAESYNAETFLKEFFNHLPGGNLTWLGYGTDKEFPRNGFFTDTEFIINNQGI